MIEAVLLDIDNTLILFDENTFFQSYITRLTPKFSDIFAPDVFQKRLISATQALLENRGQLPNDQFYMNHFSQGMEELKPELWKRFEAFYAAEFNRLGIVAIPAKGGYGLLQAISGRGIRMAIASNPLWPLSIQMMRLSWAALDKFSYSLITHIGNTCFCKPQIEFYLDICQRIKIKPENCLMVGNDPFNDMIAGKTGMQTYLATDAETRGFTSFSLSAELLRSGNPSLPVSDFQGPLSDVIKVIDRLGITTGDQEK